VADYPGAERERRVAAGELARVVTAIFAACGMDDGDAALLADTLVRSDLRGIHSHGTLRVPDYVAKLTTGGVDPRGRPRVVRDRGAIAVVDGGNSMGQVGGTFAMREAIVRAKVHGIGAAALRGSNHCGAMDWYALLAVDAGMIGIATTQALPTMAPWGGADKIVGINPLGIAFPARRHPPFVLDIAFGATAHGKMRVYAQKGATLPEGWALDADGTPTTDAAKALAGLIRPIGEHKGVGLAMAMGMLASLLSGAGYGLETGNMVDGATAGVDGQFFAAIDVAAFEDADRFRARVDGIVDQVHGSRRARGVERLLVPGEMEADFEARYARFGIPLNDATLADLAAAARARGVWLPDGWPG
jgi:LDH2 family malate/lactate/ureidoglycolate dehydrogenase